MRTLLLRLMGLGLLAGPAGAFTQAEVDQAAIAARQIDIVAVIADDLYEGRNNNTPGSAAIQEVLIDELAALGDGLNTAATGDDAYRQPFDTTEIGTNLLAVIPGSDLADEYVMVGAHYDHLGGSVPNVANGATDNAAGVAAVLAIGKAFKALPAPPRRSVILALWDAEEDQLAGSAAYVNAPLVPNQDVVAYINFDIQGSNLLPSLQNTSFVIGAETGGGLLDLRTKIAILFQTVDTRQLTLPFGQGRSDHVNLLAAAIPSVFFTDATGTCYHSSGDDISVVDLAKLREQSQIGFRLAVALSDIDPTPIYQANSQIEYDDAVTMLHVLDGAAMDIALFDAGDQASLLSVRDSVQTIVDEGPAAFGLTDQFFIANAALGVLDAIAAIPCNGFLPVPPPVPAMGNVAQFMVWSVLATGALFALRRS